MMMMMMIRSIDCTVHHEGFSILILGKHSATYTVSLWARRGW